MHAEPYSILPWSYPFRMVDRVLLCVPHERAVALKQVTTGDPALAGDGSREPCFPSALVLEGLSQTAAYLFRSTYGPESLRGAPLLGYLRARLRGAVRPGDTLVFTVTAVKMTSRRGVFQARAEVSGLVVASTELAFGVSGS